MNKATKIKKLANAIRAYRGPTKSPAGAKMVNWTFTPQPDKQKRIRELLGLMRYDKEEQDYAMQTIDGFRTLDEFLLWISSL